MRVLILGSGAREHAIAWKLAQSPRQPDLFIAPGNCGAWQWAQRVDVRADDPAGVLQFVEAHAIDLTVVGPEASLLAGVTDALRERGHAVMGPSRAASRIEWSKAFAKELFAGTGVPTAAYATFGDPEEAIAYVSSQPAPIVVKADGLAAGKGVVIAQTQDEAVRAITGIMSDKSLGDAGEQVVVEEYLEGEEVSAFCFTDGVQASPLVSARDHKRIFDGDRGPNTGGMGGYSPVPEWTSELEQRVLDTCIGPVLRGLREAGAPFQGVLFCGLMLTREGPRVLEFNARFGDPEAQLILPRLETDLLDVLLAVAEGGIDKLDLRWSKTATLGVVLASEGYPESPITGRPIHGLDVLPDGVTAFYAGVRQSADSLLTAGGRIVTLVGQAPTLAEAHRLAYAGAETVHFEGAQYRSDFAAAFGGG